MKPVAPTRGPTEDGGGDSSRPHCLRCRRAMHRAVYGAGRLGWACRPCHAFCSAHVSRVRLAPTVEGVDPRAWCVACRRPMRTQSYKRPGWSPRWKCEGCAATCRKRIARGEGPARPGEDLETRAWCMKCRRVMMSVKGRLFVCRTCHASASARPRLCRPRRQVERPACGFCGHPKAVAGKPGKFQCTRCLHARRALRSDPATAAALLREIVAALPGYLSSDEREDAAQQIALDILAAKLAPRVPAPVVLRRYASEARGLTNNRFKFISLSAPTRDGREFGETLAA
ncbi:MAG: hypothetical protein ACJ74Q_21475 [Pyrinomonadaceae bacterium]